jgi:hypothetical protein
MALKIIRRFVVECLVFQQNKGELIKALCHIEPLTIPSNCWEEVLMDFITNLPKSEGKIVIMVVVDRLEACPFLPIVSSF